MSALTSNLSVFLGGLKVSVQISAVTFVFASALGIGVPNDEPQFEAFVNTWLKGIEANGTWTKLWKDTIGTAISSGCFRLVNADVADLYGRVPVGTKVIIRQKPEL